MRGLALLLVILWGFLYSFEYDEEGAQYYANFEINEISKKIRLYHKIRYKDTEGVWLKKPVYRNAVFEIQNVFLKDRYKVNVKVFFQNGNPVKLVAYNQDNRAVKEYRVDYTKKDNVSQITQSSGGFFFDKIYRMDIAYNVDETRIRKVEYFDSDLGLRYVDFYIYFENEIKVVRTDESFNVLKISIFRTTRNKIELKEKSYEEGKFGYSENFGEIVVMRFDDMNDFTSMKAFIDYGEDKYQSVNLTPEEGSKKIISFYEDGFLTEKAVLIREAAQNDSDFASRFNYIYDGAWDEYERYIYTKGTLNSYALIQVRNGWVEDNQFHYYDEILNERAVVEKKYKYYPNGRLFSEALYINDERDSIKTYDVFDDHEIE